MTKSGSVIQTAVKAALIGGFVGVVIRAILGSGTSVLLPGFGLVVAGSLAGAIFLGLIGILLGFLFGLLAAAINISRRTNLP